MRTCLRAFGVLICSLGVGAGCFPEFGFGGSGAVGGDGGGDGGRRPGVGASEPVGGAPGGGGAPGSGAGPGAGGAPGVGAGPGVGGENTGAAPVGGNGTGGEEPVPVPQVACEESAVQCAPGDKCCFDLVGFPNDFCADASDSCGTGYSGLTCNDPSDCLSTQVCCIKLVLDGSYIDLFESSCKPSCGANEYPACESTADCANGQTCGAIVPSVPGYDAEYQGCK